MASVTSTSFRAGQTVNAYRKSDRVGEIYTGASVASGVVAAGGSVTLSGLTEGVEYVLTDGTSNVKVLAVTPDSVGSGSRPVTTIAAASGAQALAVGNGAAFRVTLTGNWSPTFTGALASIESIVDFAISTDLVGGYTITWPASVVWLGGAAPGTVAVGTTQLVTLITFDGGTTWYGSASAQGVMPSVRAYHSTTQAILNTTDTVLKFDSERFDTHAFHDPASNDGSRLVVPAGMGGLYMVGATIELPTAGAGGREIDVRLNGVTRIASATLSGNSQVPIRQSPSNPWRLADGDYIDCKVWHSATVTLTIAASTGSQAELWMHRLGA